MPKYPKGSPEAKAWGQRMAQLRNQKIKGGNIVDADDTSSEGSVDDSKDTSGIHHHHHHHHHHHYTQGGNLLGKIGNAFSKAFDPKKNGVAKTAKRIYSQAVSPVKSFAQKTFTPDLGRQIAKVAIHVALPAVVSGLASSATTALTGNPYAGYAVGQTAGKYAGKQAGDALGRTVGLGLKKGSLEAKHKMAELRALRKKK